MKALFCKDWHGTIWFTYAQNIVVRPCMDAQNENDEEPEIIKKHKLKKGKT